MPSNIVTIFEDPKGTLSKEASEIEISENGLQEAKNIDQKLRESLAPRMPAAGLAAPQIDISRKIFIFSWDRSVTHLKTALNPSYTPVGEDIYDGWEACFSSAPDGGPYQAAHTKRYKTIHAHYTTLQGESVHVELEGFAAKVFQHECDHLKGMVNVTKDNATVKTFTSKDAFSTFMAEVKSTDAGHYIAPKPLP